MSKSSGSYLKMGEEMSKGLIDLLLDTIFDADWAGKRGEKLTERELNLVKLFGRNGKVLRNIYVPKTNGETSEIDVVFITQKGIFVIESKNYSGWIFGDEKSSYWTAMLPNKEKNKFYNPVKQNRTHIKWLGQFLNDDIPLFSIVTFSERCELKKVTIESSDIHVIKRDKLYAVIRNMWDDSEDKLDEKKINAVYERLEVLTNVDGAIKAAHVEKINVKYKMAEKKPIQEVHNSNSPLICPRCSEKLMQRVARTGSNAGKSFYGCSNYPRCRYIQNID